MNQGKMIYPKSVTRCKNWTAKTIFEMAYSERRAMRSNYYTQRQRETITYVALRGDTKMYVAALHCHGRRFDMGWISHPTTYTRHMAFIGSKYGIGTLAYKGIRVLVRNALKIDVLYSSIPF